MKIKLLHTFSFFYKELVALREILEKNERILETSKARLGRVLVQETALFLQSINFSEGKSSEVSSCGLQKGSYRNTMPKVRTTRTVIKVHEVVQIQPGLLQEGDRCPLCGHEFHQVSEEPQSPTLRQLEEKQVDPVVKTPE